MTGAGCHRSTLRATGMTRQRGPAAAGRSATGPFGRFWRSVVKPSPRVRIAGATRQPPPARGHAAPYRFHKPERPGPLQKPVRRTQCAGARKRQYKPSTPMLQRVAHQHGRDGEKSKNRKSIHSGYSTTRASAAHANITWRPIGTTVAGTISCLLPLYVIKILYLLMPITIVSLFHVSYLAFWLALEPPSCPTSSCSS
jgi:hypothetical protein